MLFIEMLKEFKIEDIAWLQNSTGVTISFIAYGGDTFSTVCRVCCRPSAAGHAERGGWNDLRKAACNNYQLIGAVCFDSAPVEVQGDC